MKVVSVGCNMIMPTLSSAFKTFLKHTFWYKLELPQRFCFMFLTVTKHCPFVVFLLLGRQKIMLGYTVVTMSLLLLLFLPKILEQAVMSILVFYQGAISTNYLSVNMAVSNE